MARLQHINRNNSWDKGFEVRVDEKIYLDVSMPKGCFRVGFVWWNFQSYVQKYFPENFSYARMSDGCYDKLEIIGTCEEIVLIFELYFDNYKNHNSFHMKHLKRYLKCYIKSIERRVNVQCLEAYLKSNMSGWE